MSKLEFKNLKFQDKGDNVRIFLYRFFYFDIPKDEIEKIGSFKLENNSIEFPDTKEKRANGKFGILISRFMPRLKNSLGDKDSVYVHSNSGIPLIGNGAFGIVDRGSNLLEIKPITGCNLDCIYCSINENEKYTDFVVEAEYMVEELRKVVSIKESPEIELHIGCQGEPLLYEPLEELIHGMSSIAKVKRISMDTNATMITKEKADNLIRSGLTQFNISINSLKEDMSKKIANGAYDIAKIKEITRYVSKRAHVNIAPVLVPGFNDEDIVPLIKFVKELQKDTQYRIRLAIQKFLHYNFGKRPVKEETWESFWKKLKGYEKEYDIKLIFDASDFDINKDRSLEKPFKKHDIVKTEIVCPGRISREKIAVSQDRTISIANCSKEQGPVKVKILRDKHNIFFGIEG